MIGVVGTPVHPEDVARNLRHVWPYIAIGDREAERQIRALFFKYPESEEERAHRERLWDWDARFYEQQRTS